MRAAFECTLVVVGPFSTLVVDHIILSSASSCPAITKRGTYSTFYLYYDKHNISAYSYPRHDLALIILYYNSI